MQTQAQGQFAASSRRQSRALLLILLRCQLLHILVPAIRFIRLFFRRGVTRLYRARHTEKGGEKNRAGQPLFDG